MGSAVYQGGLFGVCGMMPQKYTGAVMTGQVKRVTFDDDDDEDDKNA